jgi:dihydrofolate synthase / folylpolyglutamate synthase
MTYDDAIRFLYGLQLFGANFGLERTRRLAALAGNPHERLRFIHVAGTNGKGSVCGLLEAIYRASGLRTGLFTSPHLVHFGERFQSNRKLPAEAEIVQLVERMRDQLAAGSRRGWWQPADVADAATGLGHPTFFEVVTVMALSYFAEQNCELVLWETGLGGRLDATNIVNPLASVITNVAVEHAAVLGNTTTKIAAEKSGIIKSGVPVVTAATDPGALRVIREVAASRGAKVREVRDGNEQSGMVDLVHLRGYQRINALTALAVVEALQPLLPVTSAQLAEGLRTFRWPGRMQEVLHDGTHFLIDGAHNPAGLRALRETLLATGRPEPRPVIFGTLTDKDIAGVLNALAPLASRIIFVAVQTPRSARPEDLRGRLAESHPELPVAGCDSLKDALSLVAGEPAVLVTGSLYLVGEAIELLGQGSDAGPPAERGLNDWTSSAAPVAQNEKR